MEEEDLSDEKESEGNVSFWKKAMLKLMKLIDSSNSKEKFTETKDYQQLKKSINKIDNGMVHLFRKSTNTGKSKEKKQFK